jgi:hypothetical protein
MSVRKFFLKLVRNLLCLVAGLSAFAACAYTDYRLWPLDLQASRYPAFPAPAIQGNRLVVPFTRKSPRSTTSSKLFCALNTCVAAKPAKATTHRAFF